MKIVEFVVSGRGTFPFDMLRYDMCWPASSRDVDLMLEPRTARTVRLSTVRREQDITDARWASFGWKVGAA